MRTPTSNFSAEKDTGVESRPGEGTGKAHSPRSRGGGGKKLLCFVVRETDLQPLGRRTFQLKWPGPGASVEDRRVGIWSRVTRVWGPKPADPSEVTDGLSAEVSEWVKWNNDETMRIGRGRGCLKGCVSAPSRFEYLCMWTCPNRCFLRLHSEHSSFPL